MAVIATGFFDGVHLGHRLVIDTLLSAARERGEQSVIVTFWPHPRTVLQDDARSLRLLTSLNEKKELLTAMGVDRVEVLDFSREFSRLTAEQYLRDYVSGRFGGSAIVLGYDNRFGSDRLGSAGIASLASSLGIDVINVPARPAALSSAAVPAENRATLGNVRGGTLQGGVGAADVFSRELPGGGEAAGMIISSTKIREALGKGDVLTAEAMLGYRYGLHGVVVAGNRLGRTIGFPTANMQLYEPLKLVPANGVYMVEVETLGRHLFGMTNIGVKPTVSGAGVRTIETHIFDFDELIYGLDIKIRFIRKIRDEQRYASMDALRKQLIADKECCLSTVFSD
ncbi:MAG: bifunctional riboflavin kinase/FMN adenylyltransferase [Bacteroidia bacterium]|nr:bifunctional riboflavin kinase/FMN adenylyltransferase [Bacteroidia bacterium]